ncbi:glycosyltransferase [Emcibacter sp. SYSU 3D8]|uniref:glycosyltransferase n=1 Tax=Emcibacter sp. SYSU 3D8 TaxID=3133969 RepID=UPI0031FE8010
MIGWRLPGGQAARIPMLDPVTRSGPVQARPADLAADRGIMPHTRSLHTVSSIESEASGPSYSVPRLCRALAARGEHVDLVSLGAPADALRDGYRDRRCAGDSVWPPALRRLGQSRAMRRAVCDADAELFHTHGLWMLPNVYPAWAARAKGRPFLLAPRGMLGAEALRFSRLKKQMFWQAAQGRAVRSVSCFHATAEQEYEDIRAFGLAQPVAIVPNGIDLPTTVRMPRQPESRTVLSLGRIHPKKGLDRLIKAWSLVEASHPDWRLEIVGPSEGGHGAELEALSRELGLNRVSVSGPVFGEAKTALMADAALFVLATRNENFAMTVAESLVCGTPVISTKGAPWAGLEEHRCGWWIDHGAEAMAKALGIAMELPAEERRAMGDRGREWMERDFGWDGIAARMSDVYRWLVHGGKRPACVRID